MNDELVSANPGKFLFYQTEDGHIRLEVRIGGETVWLTQKQMADLFLTTKQNVSLHIQNIFEEGELLPAATVKQYLTVQTEGSARSSDKRQKDAEGKKMSRTDDTISYIVSSVLDTFLCSEGVLRGQPKADRDQLDRLL